jgi:Zn-dependent protease
MVALALSWTCLARDSRDILRLLASAEGPTLVVTSICLYIVLINLSFNLFLTGTHERYAAHAYPFLIIATLVLRKSRLSKWWEPWGVGILAMLFGYYVWLVLCKEYIGHENVFNFFRSSLILGHLALFVYLWARWVGLMKLTGNPTRFPAA